LAATASGSGLESARPLLVIRGGNVSGESRWSALSSLEVGPKEDREPEGHTAYGRSVCVAGWVDTYLMTLRGRQGWHRLSRERPWSVRFLRRWRRLQHSDIASSSFDLIGHSAVRESERVSKDRVRHVAGSAAP
jgi:hypothetical protein